MSDVCAVVLAAGEGRRLRPLTATRPKALCPVGNVPLLDRALARVAALGLAAAVNACYLAEQIVAHVGERAFVSVEPGQPWGTSGGLVRLRDWIDGRHVLVGNADAYLAADREPVKSGGARGRRSPFADTPVEPGGARGWRSPLAEMAGPDIMALLDGWDAGTVRILGVPGGREFGAHRFAGFSLLPWPVVARLPAERAELVHTAWRPAQRAGRLEVVTYRGTYLDTGTPRDYLVANVHAAAGGVLIAQDAVVTGTVRRAVIGAGARIHGDVCNAVVWPGGVVHPGERLVDAIRVGTGLTVDAATAAPAAGPPRG